MPPPSQKGKFKPRKPAKKIRVGASASAVPDAAPSSSAAAAAAVAAAATTANTQTGRGAAGRGGRGDARDGGGRGGRGRGRIPIPQGQAFFTAAPPPEKKGAASKGSAAGKRPASSSSDNNKTSGAKQPASAILKEKKAVDSSEEVVGHLDKAIGSGGAQGRARRYESEDMDTSQQKPSKFEDAEGKNSGSKSYFSAEDPLYTYDSDSSAEQTNIKQVRSSNILPSRLPFPVAPLPVGVGGHERPLTYKNQANEKFYVEEEEKPVTSASHQANQIVEEQHPSPFVDVHNGEDMQREMDSFFLFQFPSRLPALVQQNVGTNENKGAHADYDGDEKMDHQETTTTKEDVPFHHATAEVATVPVQADAFDNALVNARPGRLGKLLVYKSGKTVLVLQGPNGAAEIRMNVSEGLTCSFEQQTVAIDPDNRQYVKLGDVHKTAVVTPDLEKPLLHNRTITKEKIELTLCSPIDILRFRPALT